MFPAQDVHLVTYGILWGGAWLTLWTAFMHVVQFNTGRQEQVLVYVLTLPVLFCAFVAGPLSLLFLGNLADLGFISANPFYDPVVVWNGHIFAGELIGLFAVSVLFLGIHNWFSRHTPWMERVVIFAGSATLAFMPALTFGVVYLAMRVAR